MSVKFSAIVFLITIKLNFVLSDYCAYEGKEAGSYRMAKD
jgi:hypothetical protein